MPKIKYSHQQFSEMMAVMHTNHENEIKNILIIQTNVDLIHVLFHI